MRDKDVKTIVKDLQDKFHEGTVNVIKRRLDSIFQFDLVTTDRQLSITKNVLDCLANGKVVLVDTSNMFEAEELLISTVLDPGDLRAEQGAVLGQGQVRQAAAGADRHGGGAAGAVPGQGDHLRPDRP